MSEQDIAETSIRLVAVIDAIDREDPTQGSPTLQAARQTALAAVLLYNSNQFTLNPLDHEQTK